MRESLLVEPQPARDQREFEALLDHTQSDAVYELLSRDKTEVAAEMSRFHDSRDERTGQYGYNPDLRPRSVDVAAANERVSGLMALKHEIKTLTHDPNIRNAYAWRINELIANNRILLASHYGDNRRFEAYNHFVYGKPNKHVFAATVDYFTHHAQSAANSEHQAVAAAARDVLTLFPQQGGDRHLLEPAPEVFAAVREAHFRQGGFYALLFAGVEMPTTGKVDRAMGDPILRQILQNIGAGDYTLADSSNKTWGMRNRDKQAVRPAEYNFLAHRFVGLGAGHEIGSHGLEHQNGMRSPLRLTAIGLDRYEAGNEARAVMREQIMYDTFDKFANTVRWQDIIRRHLAISLAEGADGTPRTFAQVYPLINTIDRLWEVQKKPDNPAAATEKARARTDGLLTRIDKGSDGQLITGPYYKDKVYLEGTIAVWRVAAEFPELIEQGDFGKFDIANPRHIAVLQALGVLPTSDEGVLH